MDLSQYLRELDLIREDLNSGRVAVHEFIERAANTLVAMSEDVDALEAENNTQFGVK
jgi:hypothetical protein